MLYRLCQEIRDGIRANHYVSGLCNSLAVPDMVAAMEAEDGRATPKRFAAWFDRWAAPAFNGDLPGDVVYDFRCRMLRQGRAHLRGRNYKRIVFVEPHPERPAVHGPIADVMVID